MLARLSITPALLTSLLALTACGGGAASAGSTAAPVTPVAGADVPTTEAEAEPQTETELFGRAERAAASAIQRCPRAQLGAPDTSACDEGALEAARADAGGALDAILAARGSRWGTGGAQTGEPGCGDDERAAREAWREAAVMIRATIALDCVLGGGEQVATCPAQAGSALHDAALAALQLSSGAVPLAAAIEPFGAILDRAARSGSMGMQIGWFGATIGPTVSSTVAAVTCAARAEWDAGRGLAPLAIDGTDFVLDLPIGTTSASGVAVGPLVVSLAVGTSTTPLHELGLDIGGTCEAVEDESRDGFRVFDCDGPDRVSGSREIWALTDLGAQRAIASVRVRHDAPPIVVSAMASRLRSLRRGSGDAAIDLARWGARGTSAPWASAVVDHDGRLVLADRLPPGRVGRWLQISRRSDASTCASARAASGGTSVVLDDRTLEGGGCDVAAWVAPDERGGLVVLRAEVDAEGATVAQHYALMEDEDAARAGIAQARRAIDAALRPAAASGSARRRGLGTSTTH